MTRSQGLNDTERAVKEIWAEFVPVEDIGADDDFFELGGTSLALITVVMRMSERFEIPLDTSIVVEGATIGSLAQCVERLAPASRKLHPAAADG
jgi:syringomycin synthetase protein SyrB1